MKQLIQRFLGSQGYEIRKVSDYKSQINLYTDIYPEDSLNNKRFYNIGAGGFSHPFWTNVDYDSEWYASNRAETFSGIHYDLFSLEPLPIDSEFAEIVYSSHTVEHIDNSAAQNMFNESYRILKPGGFLRITTPNIDLEYRAYRENDRNYFYWIEMYSIPKNWRRVKYNKPLNEASIEQIFLTHFASSVSTLHSDGASERIDDNDLKILFSELEYEKALNHCISKCPIEIQKKYPGNHMNWWNFRKMSSMLKEAGFTKIYLSGYGQSFCPILRDTALFDNTHPKISLYVEAIK
ncbi:MAG: methyltransferase domain-containing protein [Caldilineales bacterium]|nr:methyltransferase domain-containing protein [Caldilineales bacterium]